MHDGEAGDTPPPAPVESQEGLKLAFNGILNDTHSIQVESQEGLKQILGISTYTCKLKTSRISRRVETAGRSPLESLSYTSGRISRRVETSQISAARRRIYTTT